MVTIVNWTYHYKYVQDKFEITTINPVKEKKNQLSAETQNTCK